MPEEYGCENGKLKEGEEHDNTKKEQKGSEEDEMEGAPEEYGEEYDGYGKEDEIEDTPEEYGKEYDEYDKESEYGKKDCEKTEAGLVTYDEKREEGRRGERRGGRRARGRAEGVCG